MKAEDFIRKIYNPKFHSVWTVTTGPNQSGKTDWNLKQMEMIHDLGLGYAFGSNMHLKADFPIDFIEDFETLKKRCLMLNPDPDNHGIKRYFFFGSEMGNWAPKDMPWLNYELIRELQLVRKYGLSFLGDGIDRIDERIVNPSHFHGVFHKPSKSKPQIAIYTDWTKRGKKTTIKNITRTRITFNQFYSARFLMKPENPDIAHIPLGPEHELVWKYLDHDCSWSKAGIHREEGKRATIKVLTYHRKHCINQSIEE